MKKKCLRLCLTKHKALVRKCALCLLRARLIMLLPKRIVLEVDGNHRRSVFISSWRLAHQCGEAASNQSGSENLFYFILQKYFFQLPFKKSHTEIVMKLLTHLWIFRLFESSSFINSTARTHLRWTSRRVICWRICLRGPKNNSIARPLLSLYNCCFRYNCNINRE